MVYISTENTGSDKQPVLLRFVHRLAPDHRAQHAGLQNSRRSNFCDVAIKHDKVGQHTGLKLAFFLFGKLCVSCANGVGINRVVNGQLLLGIIFFRPRFIFAGYRREA